MESQIWVVCTLFISIVLIVLTIVKLKFHPFLALLLASFFVGAMMGMGPLDMVNAIESGIGCTIVTDSLFWLVKQYCGASLSETFKYYTTATFIASLLALAATFLLSFII
ncbi:DsdX permease [Klebsiella aerogenes]|nr:DsdX permease [Klebsiella aerogenes]